MKDLKNLNLIKGNPLTNDEEYLALTRQLNYYANTISNIKVKDGIYASIEDVNFHFRDFTISLSFPEDMHEQPIVVWRDFTWIHKGPWQAKIMRLVQVLIDKISDAAKREKEEYQKQLEESERIQAKKLEILATLHNK